MKKIQTVVEVNPKASTTHLPKVNDLLVNGWLVKKVIICYENCIHYLLEKEIPDEQDTKS